MDISNGVLDVLVSEIVLDVERVLGAPGFHSSSEVAERLEAYLQESRILELEGYSVPLFREAGAFSFHLLRCLVLGWAKWRRARSGTHRHTNTQTGRAFLVAKGVI
jgi:hypothetical protein